jgi:hypothetical protein
MSNAGVLLRELTPVGAPSVSLSGLYSKGDESKHAVMSNSSRATAQKPSRPQPMSRHQPN